MKKFDVRVFKDIALTLNLSNKQYSRWTEKSFKKSPTILFHVSFLSQKETGHKTQNWAQHTKLGTTHNPLE